MKTEKIEIKNMDIKVAKKMYKGLVKKLEKADSKKIFDYDINAHSDFCLEVVQMIDIIIGQVAAKAKINL